MAHSSHHDIVLFKQFLESNGPTRECQFEAGDLSRLYFSLCQKEVKSQIFRFSPIWGPFRSYGVQNLPIFTFRRCAPKSALCCPPISLILPFRKILIAKLLRKTEFSPNMGIVYLNHLVHTLQHKVFHRDQLKTPY